MPVPTTFELLTGTAMHQIRSMGLTDQVELSGIGQCIHTKNTCLVKTLWGYGAKEVYVRVIAEYIKAVQSILSTNGNWLKFYKMSLGARSLYQSSWSASRLRNHSPATPFINLGAVLCNILNSI